MDTNLFDAAKDVQEAELKFFKGNDCIESVFVLYDEIVYKIGFLDLRDNEKTQSEECFSTGTCAKLTIASDEITFSIDRFNLNRLTEEDFNHHYIQVSKQTSLVKYKNNYYFVHDSLAKDFRRFARQCGKDAADIVFVIPVNQIKLDFDQMLTLSQESQKRNQKFDIHFGPFEYYSPIRVDNTIKRYVTNSSGHFIQIEDHLVNDIRLETAVYTIDKKASFTPIVAAIREPTTVFNSLTWK